MELRHFLQFSDLSRAEHEYLLERARWIKAQFKDFKCYHPLVDRTLAMIFEKQSTRTRLSFEAGVQQLGGAAIYLNTRDTQLGRGERVEDMAQVVSRMVDLVMIRTFEQEIVERFAAGSRVPVINGLTNEYHPCQVLGDIFTFIEHRGPITGKTVAWIGDSNNVCNTWLQAAAIFDFKLHISTPPGYEAEAERAGIYGKQHCEHFADPMEAARGADLLTTDVWTSMGFEAEDAERKRDFSDWQVDAAMMKRANPDALFMHCLPAHRGEEVTTEVLDGPQSVVWDEAENRMHTQKALMEFLLLEESCERSGAGRLIDEFNITLRRQMAKSQIRKVVLAYSGGLDTSVILKWLQDQYGCEVITFTADIGQGEELEPARKKAKQLGVKKIFVDDLREEFVRDFVFPMFRANAIYEGEYLLGTSIARPLIAKRQIEIARMTGADAVSHGATGKGNDQVRFELGYYALEPNIRVIAPWREWDLVSREKLLAYAEKHGIPVAGKKKAGSPYSTDANLLHISYEGRILEDPAKEPEADMWSWTVSPEEAPDRAEYVELEFRQGDIIAVNGKKLSPVRVLETLNKLGGKHGIGRLDLVENRYVGMKSRGCYETPGGTIMLRAHRAVESVCLDREVAHLKDDLMPRYAALIYNGYWWSPERRMLQAMIDASQANVNGWVRIKLYKGNVVVVGRDSKSDSLFDTAIATFEDDRGAFNQMDAAGFIRLNALRMRIAANLRKRQRK